MKWIKKRTDSEAVDLNRVSQCDLKTECYMRVVLRMGMIHEGGTEDGLSR